MPFNDEDNCLCDIADAIGMMESFAADIDFEAFSGDPKTVAAVERKLQISDAAIRLGEGAERRCPASRGGTLREYWQCCVTNTSESS